MTLHTVSGTFLSDTEPAGRYMEQGFPRPPAGLRKARPSGVAGPPLGGSIIVRTAPIMAVPAANGIVH